MSARVTIAVRINFVMTGDMPSEPSAAMLRHRRGGCLRKRPRLMRSGSILNYEELVAGGAEGPQVDAAVVALAPSPMRRLPSEISIAEPMRSNMPPAALRWLWGLLCLCGRAASPKIMRAQPLAIAKPSQ